MNTYFALNTNWIDAKQPAISLESRIFKYGDGFFQSMLFHNGSILFLENHLKRIQNSLTTLLLPKPILFNIHKLNWFIQQKTAELNWKTCNVRISFLRESLGTYTPTSSEETIVITQIQKTEFYSESTNFNELIPFLTVQKHADSISHIKHCNSLVYVLAAKHAVKNNVTASLIFNSKNMVCEAQHANIFICKHNIMYTPLLSDGCQNGTMREICMQLANQSNISIIEKSLTEDEITTADEVFITNISSGFILISKYQSSTFTPNIGLLLQKLLISSYK